MGRGGGLQPVHVRHLHRRLENADPGCGSGVTFCPQMRTFPNSHNSTPANLNALIVALAIVPRRVRV